MARYADAYQDIFIHEFTGDVDPTGKILIPATFDNLVIGQLRFVNLIVTDVSTYTTFYIDAQANKHATQIDGTWQQLNCSWNSDLVKDVTSGQWRVRDYRDDLFLYATSKRMATERKGIFVDAGTGRTFPVGTDDRSKMLTNEATLLAQSDPDCTIKWRCADGSWETLNAQQVLTVASKVAEHVQVCFATGAQVDADIQSGVITTTAQIDAAFNAIAAARYVK